MRLPPFQMHRPTSVADAVTLLEELGEDAALYCGGSELLLVMKLGLTDLAHLIDVKGLESLRTITTTESSLRIGAAATYREIATHELVQRRWPAFASMINGIANVRVRTVGTLGGNLGFADPASDPATFLTAIGAGVDISGPGGSSRTVMVEDLAAGAYQTVLAGHELIEAIVLPDPLSGSITVHNRLKFQERPAITVTVSARSVRGQIVDARVAVGAVVPTPARYPDAEAQLKGTTRASVPAAATTAGETTADQVPLRNSGGDQAYERQLTRVLVARTAAEAMQSALTA